MGRVEFATTNMKTQLLKLLNSLRDKAYRAVFVETQIEALIPFQIRAMRATRGWTQKQLAEKAEMKQGRISVLENPNYEGAVNVKTLLKLAAAFDVGLIVRFAPFSEIAEWSTTLTRAHHYVPSFSGEIEAQENMDEEMPESVQVSVVTNNQFSLNANVKAA